VGFLQDQKTRLAEAASKNEKVGFFREKIWPELEKFIIAGPTFVGFVLGVWKYSPGQRHFETAFQSLLVFAAYMAVLIFFQALDTLFLGAWPVILGIARSVLALLYLAITIKQYFEWRSGEVRIYGFTVKLRTRLNQKSGNAI
jgi:hypothetical protein